MRRRRDVRTLNTTLGTIPLLRGKNGVAKDFVWVILNLPPPLRTFSKQNKKLPASRNPACASLPLRFDNWSSPPARILWPRLHPSSPAPLEQLLIPFPLRRVVAPDVRRCICGLATISITNHF